MKGKDASLKDKEPFHGVLQLPKAQRRPCGRWHSLAHYQARRKGSLQGGALVTWQFIDCN